MDEARKFLNKKIGNERGKETYAWELGEYICRCDVRYEV
jgi:hypothetical protein